MQFILLPSGIGGLFGMCLMNYLFLRDREKELFRAAGALERKMGDFLVYLHDPVALLSREDKYKERPVEEIIGNLSNRTPVDETGVGPYSLPGARPDLRDEPDNLIKICHNHHLQSHDGFLALGRGSCSVRIRKDAEGKFEVVERPERD